MGAGLYKTIGYNTNCNVDSIKAISKSEYVDDALMHIPIANNNITTKSYY